jgi:uncharacterized membrane protein (DUF106 family)
VKSDRKKINKTEGKKKKGKWKQQKDNIQDIMTSMIQSHLQSNLMIWVSVIELLYFLIPWILIFCFLHLLFKVVVNITFAPKKSSILHFYLLIFVHQLFRHWYL